VLLGYIT